MKKTIYIIIAIIVFLSSAGYLFLKNSNLQRPKENNSGIVCGTIDGIPCPDGYECKLDDPNIDDGGGFCVRIEVTPKSGTPATEEECLQMGGTWGKWGLLAEVYCQIPSNDFDKDCTDGDQCQYGRCIAGWNDEIPGKCQKFPRVFGCMSFVEDGKIEISKICID